MKITLHEGGTAEQTIELAQLQIPDLWRVETTRDADRELVIKCWHIAHALKRELLEREAKLASLQSALERIAYVVGHNSCSDGKTPNGFAVALDHARAALKQVGVKP